MLSRIDGGRRYEVNEKGRRYLSSKRNACGPYLRERRLLRAGVFLPAAVATTMRVKSRRVRARGGGIAAQAPATLISGSHQVPERERRRATRCAASGSQPVLRARRPRLRCRLPLLLPAALLRRSSLALRSLCKSETPSSRVANKTISPLGLADWVRVCRGAEPAPKPVGVATFGGNAARLAVEVPCPALLCLPIAAFRTHPSWPGDERTPCRPHTRVRLRHCCVALLIQCRAWPVVVWPRPHAGAKR